MHPAEAPARRGGGPFRLAHWEVQPARSLLVGPDGTRHLEPKVMDVLVLLAERSGEVVSKETITDSVWESRIIAEGTLTNAVAELRQALGDDARAPRFIETIPKRGYRLMVSSEPLPPADEQPVEQPGQAPGGRRGPLLAGVAVLVAAAGVMAWFLLGPPSPDPQTVLVAPFANRTGNPSLDPLGLLAREHLVSRLSASGLARAIPGPSTGSGDDLALLSSHARKAGAGLAIAGDLFLRDGQLEVQARLVDAGRAELLYGVPSARAPLVNASEALGEAESRALGALAAHLTAHAHSTLLSQPPRFEAYREFIVGSDLFATNLPTAVEHLERAVEIDPQYTSASIRLAVGLRNLNRAAEGRAVLARLDERRADLNDFERLWLDWALAVFDGRREEALVTLRRIEPRIPSDPVLHLLIGNAALAVNRPREAVAALAGILTWDPPDFLARHPMLVNNYRAQALASYMAGDLAGALAAARAGLERYPTDHTLHVIEGKALAALGEESNLDAVIAAVLATPSRMPPANLLVEAAAAARAHGRPALSGRLARHARELLEANDGDGDPQREALLRAEALVLLGDLEGAQGELVTLAPEPGSAPSEREVSGLGWLGAVAARRGDLTVARAADAELAGVRQPDLRGVPTYYRAAIAAWLGKRERAVELLQRAQAEGWGRFWLLHDEERVLFEPLEGLPAYEAILHPTG